MNAGEFMEALGAVARQLDGVRPGAHWYLFGSALKDWESAADIDVAIVCPDDEGCRLARAALAGLAESLPVHLILLTKQEEAELNFIPGVSAELIFPRGHR